jgi:osmoprotectant transport system substrate-binding protein
MRLNRALAAGLTLSLAIAACGDAGQSPAPTGATEPTGAPTEAPGAKPDINIGSDAFYESQVVAEMFAQVLEADGYTVTRTRGIGARQVRQPALENGDIDLSPEYVGSGLGYYDTSDITGDGQANRDALADILADMGISVFGISPGEDTNAAVVRQDTAESRNLARISDLVPIQDELTWGLPGDCDVNPLCKDALEQYGINYPPQKREALAACDSPIAEALRGQAIDFAWLCSTQPAIAQYGFVVLEDDLGTQPAENMPALVRDDYLEQVGDPAAFQKLLDDVLATLTTEELTNLGVEIAVNNKEVSQVAREYLTAKGLLD